LDGTINGTINIFKKVRYINILSPHLNCEAIVPTSFPSSLPLRFPSQINDLYDVCHQYMGCTGQKVPHLLARCETVARVASQVGENESDKCYDQIALDHKSYE
jgi:hypothetical protein